MVARFPRLLRWSMIVTALLLLLMTLARLIFYWRYNPPGKLFSGSAFLLGLRYDGRYAAAIGLFILLCCTIRFFNPFVRNGAARFWNFFLPLLLLVLFFVYVTDFFHYDYLHQRLNASILNYAEDVAISGTMVLQTYPIGKVMIVAVVLLVLTIIGFRALLHHFMVQPDSGRRGIGAYLFFVVLLGAMAYGKLGQFPLRWSDAFLLSDDYKAQLALNPMQSFLSTLNFRRSKPNLQKVKDYYPVMRQYLGINTADSSTLSFTRIVTPAGTPRRLNVVLVICESFSVYKSTMAGNPLNATPFFDSLCRQGVFFDRCFTPAYGTARGVWATITGTPDVESPKTASRNPAAVDQHTIINDFTSHDKFYFLGGNPTWANIQGLLANNINGLKIYSQNDFAAKKVDVWGISDKNLFLEAHARLAKTTTPFFAIIQTADNHRPYTIPAEDATAFPKLSFPEDMLRKYGFESNAELNAFRYTDFCFRQFMQAARTAPYFDSTLFVFIGDHGIRGLAGALLPESYTSMGLTCEHVPLLFYAPGWLPAKRIPTISSQIDVLPTIAGLLQQPYRNTTLGRDLFRGGPPANYIADPLARAFFIDHDDKTIGILNDSVVYRKNMANGKEDLLSLIHNNALPRTRTTDSVLQSLRRDAQAFYETSRWLLVNNKKPVQ
jgi:phosphoglycerol transferase MdoB-like AlkP superfamily enzyme